MLKNKYYNSGYNLIEMMFCISIMGCISLCSINHIKFLQEKQQASSYLSSLHNLLIAARVKAIYTNDVTIKFSKETVSTNGPMHKTLTKPKNGYLTWSGFNHNKSNFQIKFKEKYGFTDNNGHICYMDNQGQKLGCIYINQAGRSYILNSLDI